jgi:hypothetical protein
MPKSDRICALYDYVDGRELPKGHMVWELPRRSLDWWNRRMTIHGLKLVGIVREKEAHA